MVDLVSRIASESGTRRCAYAVCPFRLTTRSRPPSATRFASATGNSPACLPTSAPLTLVSCSLALLCPALLAYITRVELFELGRPSQVLDGERDHRDARGPLASADRPAEASEQLAQAPREGLEPGHHAPQRPAHEPHPARLHSGELIRVFRTLSVYSFSTVVFRVDSGEADYLSLSIGTGSERNGTKSTIIKSINY